MTIFLLSPIFVVKYENLSWSSKERQQEKAKSLNQDGNQEKLDEKFSSKPFMKKTRYRPRKNLLTNLKNIPFQTKKREVDQENEYMKMNYQKYMCKKEAEQK